MSLIIKAEERKELGKNACYRLRRKGLVPAILYGPGIKSLPLCLNKKDIFTILKTETGERTIFRIVLNGEERDVMIKELQVDPVTDELLHVDLVQIAMDRPIRVSVPIVLQGEAIGVKTQGGLVDFITRELEIECLPHLIPEHITVDISPLHVHQSIRVGDLPSMEGIRIVDDPETVIVTIGLPEAEAVTTVAAEEGVVVEAPEPEVIRKERAKKEEE
ncbi:MAG: 50S ribosomal protein L25 [Candidatus Aminicenantes bacterium]|nr:50S ribosomal protein L25 [Candidatus Aminicenantes bacterium]